MTKQRIAVATEAGTKRVFATAVDWPGWSRSGKTEQAALEALEAYSDRHAGVVRKADEKLTLGNIDFDVVERTRGGGGTDFGVPSNVTEQDRRPLAKAEAQRRASLVDAAWRTFNTVVKAAPEELRKGPRGGGRNTSKIVEHVAGADEAYAREMGIKLNAPIEQIRAEMLRILREPSDGTPLAGRKWTARYAAHRIAWHALDHAWEIEDRSDS